MTTHTRSLTTETLMGHALLRALLAEDERDARWLAGKTGYSPSHIWRVVHEGRRISDDLGARLGDLFGVEPARFTKGHPRRRRHSPIGEGSQPVSAPGGDKTGLETGSEKGPGADTAGPTTTHATGGHE